MLASALAFARTKPIPRHAAAINLTALVEEAHAKTADAVVNHLAGRFLSVALAQKDRSVLVEFLQQKVGGASIRRMVETLESI